MKRRLVVSKQFDANRQEWFWMLMEEDSSFATRLLASSSDKECLFDELITELGDGPVVLSLRTPGSIGV